MTEVNADLRRAEMAENARVFQGNPRRQGLDAREQVKLAEIRMQCETFANRLCELCPSSFERDQAIAKLREVKMWANSAISCNGG